MYGFRFTTDNIDKHSSEYGIYIKTKNLPPLAKKRIVEEVVPNRHGSYKFENGYEDKIIELECVFIESDFTLRRLKMREISQWLSQEGQLILDYESDKYYIGRLVGISTKIDNSVDILNLTFKVKPFAYSTYLNENVILDSEVYLYSYIPVGYDLENNFYVTGYQEATVTNLGTFEAMPVIEIDGTADSISVSNSTGGFTIQNITEKVYVDCEKMLCYTIDAYGEKVNKLIDFTGSFVKIPVGDSTFTIDGTNLNVNVFFNYRNTYL
jgi:phage-related protein